VRDSEGNRYALNEAGAVLCLLASHPVDVRSIVSGIATQLGQPEEGLERPIVDYLLELNRRGLLSIHRSFAREAVDRLATLPFPGGAHRVRRYAPTVANVVRGCLEGHQLTMWSLLLVVGLAGAGTLVFATASEATALIPLRAIVLALSFFALVHWASILIHELAHLAAARLTGCSIRAVYVRSGAMGIAFAAPSTRARIVTVGAGALAAIGFLALVLGALVAFPGAWWALAGIDQLRLSTYAALGALMLAQAACFTPLTRDGRELLQAVRARSGTRAPR
jgi:hypothetical protein